MPRLARWIVLGVVVVAFGCGDSEQRRPDTGAGSGLPVPATVNCADFCTRAGDCLAILCNEDTNSTMYDILADLAAAQCQQVCTDAALMSSGLTPAAWQCLFMSSCRQAFDYDTCNAMSSYMCS